MNDVLIYCRLSSDADLIRFVLKGHVQRFIDYQESEKLSVVDLAFIDLSLPAIEVKAEKAIVLIASPDQKFNLIEHVYPEAFITLISPLNRAELSRVIELFESISPRGLTLFNRLIDYKIAIALASQDITHSPLLDETLYDGLIHFCLEECKKVKAISKAENYRHEELVNIDSKGQLQICDQRPGCQVYRFIDFLEHQSEESKNILHLPLRDIIGNPETISLSQMLSNIDQFINELMGLRREFCESHCSFSQKNTDYQAGNLVLVELLDLIKGRCVYCRQPECSLSRVFKHFSDYF